MSMKGYWGIAVLIGLFILAGLLRLNDLSLSTDSTRYLIWGNSLAHFQGYVDDTRPVPTRFVMNAPLYPLLLAPVEIVFPMSLNAAKIWTLLLAAAGLLLFHRWLKPYVGALGALIACLLLALNPLFLITSTEVMSEAPFLLFSMVIFLTVDRFLNGQADRRTLWGMILALALVTLLREVGAAFVLAALVVLFRRKNGRELLIVGGAAIALFLFWSLRNVLVAGTESGEATNMKFLFGRFLTGPSDSIVSELESRFWVNLKEYLVQIGGAIVHPLPEELVVQPSGLYELIKSALQVVQIVVSVCVGTLMLYGIKLDNPGSASGLFRLIGFCAYWFIILMYPVHDIRFLLPMVPLLFFYMVLAAAEIGRRSIRESWRTAAALGISAVVLFPNLVTNFEILRTNLRYQANPETFAARAEQAHWFGQPWSAAGRWINDNLPEDAVLASPAKEIAAFVGNRKVLETSRILPTPIFERILRDHGARYVLTTVVWDDMETFEIAMMESRRMWFEPLHSVSNLTIYRVHSSMITPPSAISPDPDTSAVKGKILRGRNELAKLRYENALRLFNQAMRLAPQQPEPVFQLMTVLCILGDSVSTMELNEKLFTLPRSTAYSQLAQANIGILEQLLRAERQTFPQRSYTAFEAGLACWGLGYQSTALAIMRNIANSDTTHFSAPLWGCYYARQLGDTTESDEFLNRVKRIDFAAPIVGDWESMKQLENQLRTATKTDERVKLHVRISRIFSRLELFDEALDALERAMRLEPDNIDLLLARAEVFEKKRAIYGASRVYGRILELEPHNSFAKERLDTMSVNL